MNQEIKQEIINAIGQKSLKGFHSRLPYVTGITIFPDCWNLQTELTLESELLWKDLCLSKCLQAQAVLSSLQSVKGTQTDAQSLHNAYLQTRIKDSGKDSVKENRKREHSPSDFKSAAELFQEENEKQNGSGLRKIVTKKSKFISPLLQRANDGNKDNVVTDERLKNLDPNMVTMIKNEVVMFAQI
jgi:hypothetical protein